MRLVTSACLLAFIAGCTCDKGGVPDAGPVDAGPALAAEKEPNDRPDNALRFASTIVL